MKTIESKLIIAIISFIIMLISGILLSKTGKPYNVLIFTLHKITSMLTIIFTVLALIHKQSPSYSGLLIIAIVICASFFLILMVSGALISLNKPVSSVFLTIHKISPIILILSFVTICWNLWKTRNG